MPKYVINHEDYMILSAAKTNLEIKKEKALRWFYEGIKYLAPFNNRIPPRFIDIKEDFEVIWKERGKD